jgi:hypothetical protein
MTDEDERELESELARLQQEHRDLDAAIDALHQSPAPDLLRLQRLKKRKLQLRDRIAFIEDQITPDIIAERISPAARQFPQHAGDLFRSLLDATGPMRLTPLRTGDKRRILF